jgi:hypothetical protein
MHIQLLLHLQKVCNQDNIKLPWDEVGAQMSASITGGAIIQHLSKLRARRVALGLPVPEPLKRGGGWGVSAPAHNFATERAAAASPGSANGNAGKRRFDDGSECKYEDPKGSHQRKRAKHMEDEDCSKQYAGKTVAKHDHPDKGTSVVAPTEYASGLIKKEAPSDSNLSAFSMESMFAFHNDKTSMTLPKEVGRLFQGHCSQVQTSKHSESLRAGGVLTLRFIKKCCLTFLRRIHESYNSSSSAGNVGIHHHTHTSNPSYDSSTAMEPISSGHISFRDNSANHLTADGREICDSNVHQGDQMEKISANGTNPSYGTLKYESLSGYLNSTGNGISLNPPPNQLLAFGPGIINRSAFGTPAQKPGDTSPISLLTRPFNYIGTTTSAPETSQEEVKAGGVPAIDGSRLGNPSQEVEQPQAKDKDFDWMIDHE